jgi:hypothetical protein
MLRRELQLDILTWREVQRLGRAQAQALDVVRQVFNRGDRRFHDSRRMHDHFVRLRDLDGAGLDQHALAGQHMAIAVQVRHLVFLSQFHHLARHDFATAGSTTARDTAVRNRDRVLPEHLKQVGTWVHVDQAVLRLYEQVHHNGL